MRVEEFNDGSKKGYSKLIMVLLLISDLFIINCAFLFSYFIKFNYNPLAGFKEDHDFFLLAIYNLVWIILVLILGLYIIKRVSRFQEILKNILKAVSLHFLIIVSFIFSIKGHHYSREQLLLSYIFIFIGILVCRIAFIIFIKRYRSAGHNFRKVIIIGANESGNQLYKFINSNPDLGYHFDGFFDNHQSEFSSNRYLGTLAGLESYIENYRVDEIFCALPMSEIKEIRKLITIADNNLLRLKFVLDYHGLLNHRTVIDFYNQIPVFTVRSEPLEYFTNKIIKRLFDILFSLLILIFVFPPILIIVFFVNLLTSRGPVFFSQKRSGLNNKIFNCYKFRSMVPNKESDDLQATRGDIRVTSMGKFLRKSSIDELPQFYNVLIGNMSVIGPRPHPLKLTDEYSKLVDKYMVRHFAKPGITGWAQVSGYRGPTPDIAMMEKRVECDIWYIENYSFFLDVKIIFKTIYLLVDIDPNAI